MRIKEMIKMILKRVTLGSLAALILLVGIGIVSVGPFSDNVAKPAFANEEAAGTAEEASAEAEVDPNVWSAQPAPKLEAKDYPQVSGFNSRVGVWIVAQLHLFFAAFVLGVPMFVLAIEYIGYKNGDTRYDKMAHEFMKVAMTGFSLAASFGGLLSIMLVVFYPDFMKYLTGIFGKAMLYYGLMFFAESFFVYTYYYGWNAMQGDKKKTHMWLGLGLNVAGMTLMFVSNSWASFMMAPSGVAADGMFLGSVWEATAGFLWNPLNLHRFIANIAYGGSLTAAYAAYKYISTSDPEEKAHYDWMAYTSFIIAVIGLLPLPFAGYWLTKEIYDYSQQMGITLMGGAFAWLFIIQAVLIGAIFLSANYYLWCSLTRSHGAERYKKLITPLGLVIIFAFLVWFTPHTLVMTSTELSQIGGAHHSVLGPLGVMAAKNSAVNVLILATYLSFQIFRRSNLKITGGDFWAKNGTAIQIGLYGAGVGNIVILGIYSYFIPAATRIGLSIPQVTTTAVVIIIATIIDGKIFKKSEELGDPKWGSMPVRAQYALFMLAISFTWLMGLMGYCRSAIRQHWHVYTIFRDNSPDAFTPTLPYAAGMVTVICCIFIALVLFMFWMPQLASKKAGK